MLCKRNVCELEIVYCFRIIKLFINRYMKLELRCGREIDFKVVVGIVKFLSVGEEFFGI